MNRLLEFDTVTPESKLLRSRLEGILQITHVYYVSCSLAEIVRDICTYIYILLLLL